MKAESRSGNAGVTQRQINDLRHETSTSTSRPTINQQYAETFNAVDRWNKLMGKVSYIPRCSSPETRILIGVVTASIVQAWVLVNNEQQGNEDSEIAHLKRSAQSLARSLVE
jgi:hypothetical protein